MDDVVQLEFPSNPQFYSAEEAMKLFRERKVKGIFWLNERIHIEGCLRQIALTGTDLSDWAFVEGSHPLTPIIPS